MPHHCIVPECTNKSEKPSCAELSFHRLPLNDPERERTNTRCIAAVRIHVERAIECIKNYSILHNVPNNMHNKIDHIFFVCAVLTNFLE